MMKPVRTAALVLLSAGCVSAAAHYYVLRSPHRTRVARFVRTAKAAVLTHHDHPAVMRVEDLPPVVLRKLTPEELTPSLIRKAEDVLWKFDSPVGSEIVLEDQGRSIVARFEEHFHEVGGPLRPWGYHKGITLYEAE